jgi:hypothetical protein
MLSTEGIVEMFQLQMLPAAPVSSNPVPLAPEIASTLALFPQLFDVPRGLPPARPTDHHISLQDGANPVNVQPYRYPHFQKREIEKLLKEMLDEGIIQRSTNPFSSPVLLVRKKDGSGDFVLTTAL